MGLAVDIGRKLQQEYPQIAEDYRALLSKPQIVRKHVLVLHYHITSVVAERAVDFALRGYHGELEYRSPYAGLIPASELEELCIAHQQRNGRFAVRHLTFEDRSRGGRHGGSISGPLVAAQKLGAHAMTSEEKRELGYRNLENKVGIHAMTSEEKREAGRKGFVAWMERRGIPLWTAEEEREAYVLAQACRRGMFLDRDAVAKEINRQFHEGKPYRTGATVYQAIRRYERTHKPL